jgi:hypothetical protein
MASQTICPRCGSRDSFMKGYLPDTCVCRVCLSQLDWREIPGCGPDCTAATASAGDEPKHEGRDAAGGTEDDEERLDAPGGARGGGPDLVDEGNWDV